MIITNLEIALMKKLNDTHNENHRLDIRNSQLEEALKACNKLCLAIIETKTGDSNSDNNLIVYFNNISVTELYKKNREVLNANKTGK